MGVHIFISLFRALDEMNHTPNTSSRDHRSARYMFCRSTLFPLRHDMYHSRELLLGFSSCTICSPIHSERLLEPLKKMMKKERKKMIESTKKEKIKTTKTKMTKMKKMKKQVIKTMLQVESDHHPSSWYPAQRSGLKR